VKILPYCEKCSGEISDEDQFCPQCGEPLRTKARIPPRRPRRAREEELCFGGGERRGDPLGWVEFGLFIIIVGVVYTLNPRILSEFISWVESMADFGFFIRPPTILTNSAMVFFALLGGSNFLVAAIRVYMDKVPMRILQDVLAGIALFVFSYLISLYGDQSIAWTTVLALEAILIGVLVIAFAFLKNQF
jgi:hypothetical protein